MALDEGLRVTLGDRVGIPSFMRRSSFLTGPIIIAGVGNRPSRWLEISFGKFDEEDIVRLEDHYGRK